MKYIIDTNDMECKEDKGTIVKMAVMSKRNFNKLFKTKEEKLWSYLSRKLRGLNDHNRTAREIWQYINKLK